MAGVEKVLFASVDINALGVVVEPDARGNAAVVKSMLTPLQVDISISKKNGEGEEDGLKKGFLEVGDVLFAVNGKLVHDATHSQVLKMLKVDTFGGSDGIRIKTKKQQQRKPSGQEMIVLSFMDPYWYYQKVKNGTLTSHAFSDNALFGKIKQAGWRDYLLGGWSLFGSGSGSAKGEDDYKRENCGAAYLKFSAGEYKQALAVYTSVLEREPLSHTVRVSRSMCYLKLGDPKSALKDARTCCALKPEWPMAYVCMGAALDAMDKSLDACCAYVCGLVVDPANSVLRAKLNALFAKMRWHCIILDGKQVIGSIASAAIHRDDWASDLFADRIILFSDKRECDARLLGTSYYTVANHLKPDRHPRITIQDQEKYEQAVAKGLVIDGLYSGDEIVSINSFPIHDMNSLRTLVEDSPGVVIVGIFSGSRVAAQDLLDANAVKLTERVLSEGPIRRTLFNIHIKNCGAEVANGTYIPQELRDGAYVYENQNGCLLSFERVRVGQGWVAGWVIGRDSCILYTALFESADNSHDVLSQCTDVEFCQIMKGLKWKQCYGADPAPTVVGTSLVPTLGFFTGEEGEDGTSNSNDGSDIIGKKFGTSPNKMILTSSLSQDEFTSSSSGKKARRGEKVKEFVIGEWTADLQILAIKGYGNRSLNCKEYEKALKCFDLVEAQIEPMISELELDGVTVPTLLHHTESALSPMTARSTDTNISGRVKADRSISETSLETIIDEARQSYLHDLEVEQELTYRSLMLKVLVNKARLFLDLGKPRKALSYAERACDSSLNSSACPLPYYLKAMALAAMEDEAKALISVQHGLEIAGPSTIIGQRLIGLREELRVQQLRHAQEKPKPSGVLGNKIPSSRMEGKYEKIVEEEEGTTDVPSPSKSGPTKTQSSLSSSPDPFVTCEGPFTDAISQKLHHGIQLQYYRYKGKEHDLKMKSRLLELSSDGACLHVSKVVALFYHKTRATIKRDRCRGVVLGVATSAKDPISVQPDPKSFTIVTDHFTYAFMAHSEQECTQVAQMISAWINNNSNN